MNRKLTTLAMCALLVFMLALVGCAKKQEPKELINSVVEKTSTMTSYEMATKLTINDLSFTSPALENDPTAGMMMSMLKDAELTVNGVYQLEPAQTEVTVGIHLKGDMATELTIPMVVTQDKMYVKIPRIPMLPMPETVVGKFLELDLKELAEQSGGEFTAGSVDQVQAQKLVNELSTAVLAEYDQDTYFKDIDPKDAALPEGVNAKQVVQFSVTNDNVQEALNIFITKALPNVLDILAKEEYKELLQGDQAEIVKAKEELQANSGEITKQLDELKKSLKVNQFDVNTAVNSDDLPIYQEMKANLEFNDAESQSNVKVAFTGTSQYSKINEKQTFVIGIPTGDDVITMEEFQQQTGAGF
ncbi:hypothetical protein [Paenibacillus massiliensis]|uniref:hypothetical protein n=1 Tax=Paenibacillus massiliensis TaxID=225917 RepID=UPI000419E213|nr:hypothetical protein [Paenibacillus massiliensis]